MKILFSILVVIVSGVLLLFFHPQQTTTGTTYFPYMNGTTGSIGGSVLIAGACSTGTVTVNGAAVGMPVLVSASDGTNIPALGVNLSGTVTAANTVSVSVCAIVALTPTAKTYSVRVFP